MKRPLPWFTMPVAVLSIGVLLAGFVVYRIFTRDNASVQPANTQSDTNVGGTCGNGVCENVACLGTNCPTPESSGSCPEDCGTTPTDGTNSSVDNQNLNQNGNINSSTGSLDFTTTAQSLEEKNSCPVEEANLSPSDAVGIASRAGLEQGIQSVSVALALSEAPLEQCVWTVKNYLRADGGRQMLIVDSTQDVYRTSSWGQSGA